MSIINACEPLRPAVDGMCDLCIHPTWHQGSSSLVRYWKVKLSEGKDTHDRIWDSFGYQYPEICVAWKAFSVY